ncbi:MAG: peptide-methionine (S)-S-oxide reductase MsrA [Flavobacteriales bacterium]
MRRFKLYFLISIPFLSFACDQVSNNENSIQMYSGNKIDTATFGAGCFWCVEAVFQQMKGVEKIVSGYSGGKVKNPTYKEICSGLTGHAEVVQIYYDSSVVSFDKLLEVFWATHDPTTPNRQGADVGTQYRSVVFYHNDNQQEIAEKYKQKLNEANAYENPVVTEISPIINFYKAEDYHQNYFNDNTQQPYCQFVIQPKVDKFRKVFAENLK